jgi:hypothetical protein
MKLSSAWLPLLVLPLLPLLAGTGCGDSGGSSGDGAATDAPAAQPDGAVTSDATASDTSASDAGATEGGTSTADTATTPAPDGAATGDARADLTLVKAAWTASYAAYLQSALPAYIMIVGKAGMQADVMVPQNCPEGGTTLLAGPGMVVMNRTTADLVLTFSACKINGFIINGKWAVKQDIVTQMGGFDDLSGDLTFSGAYSNTCPTMVRRTITATSQTASGTFCGEDITKW